IIGNEWMVNPRYQGVIGLLRRIFKRKRDYADYIYIKKNEVEIYKVPVILGKEKHIVFDEPIPLKESDSISFNVSLKKYYVPNVELTSHDYELVEEKENALV
ncbi:unnamed protein product, partial [marine sediment metagenome]